MIPGQLNDISAQRLDELQITIPGTKDGIANGIWIGTIGGEGNFVAYMSDVGRL